LNQASSTTRQLYDNRLLSVEQYVIRFRKSGIQRKLPGEALSLTVEAALAVKRIGNVNVRKLLVDLRDKFVK